MKKLLLLINLLFSIFIWASCQNRVKQEQENPADTKPLMSDSMAASDTTKAKGQTESSGIVGTGSGISKDSIPAQQNNNAIKHHAPNEAKIDSIKEAKLKGKK